MASNVSVSYTFTNSTTADADEVNSNFSSLVSWINTNAVHLDGSKVFTGAPSYASDPVSNNQLCRKYYVDNKTWAAANIQSGAITTAKLSTTSGEIAGDWTSWTRSSGFANVTGGSVSGKYWKCGYLLHFTFEFTAGTATAAGYVDAPLPTGMLAANDFPQGVHAWNSGTMLAARTVQGDDSIRIFANTSSADFGAGASLTNVRVNGTIRLAV